MSTEASKLPVAGLAALCLVLAACGGGSSGSSLIEAPTAESSATGDGPPAASPSTTPQPEPSTTQPPPATTTPAPTEFVTVAGAPPHALDSYSADISIVMALPNAVIEVRGDGVFTSAGFSCEWTADVLGETSTQTVMGSPANVWVGAGGELRQLPAATPEALGAQSLCPSSPAFWSELGLLPELGEPETKNEIAARRVDVTEAAQGVPGVYLSQAEGVELDSAVVWIAEDGEYVSAIELVMTVGPDAATRVWGVPFDPDSKPTEMTYTVNVAAADDPTLEVSLPDAADLSLGYGSVTVDGAPLPAFEPEGLDSAIRTTAPTVAGADWDGASHTIGPDGRPKIVVFLAHWCPHCQEEVPATVEWLEAGNLPDTVDMYAVTAMTDPARDNWPPQDWLIAEGWAVPTIMGDAAGTASDAFGSSGVPYYVVLDGDNKVLLRASGAVGAEGLATLVEVALAG